MRPVTERFWSKVSKDGPTPVHRPELGQCWVWAGYLPRDGYGRFYFNGRPGLAHRFSWFLEHGKWPEPCALHRCDNPACVRPDHLFEGSKSDNMRDCAAKGRHLYGERNGFAKLNEQQVATIRRRYEAGGVSQNALALEYGVSRRNIGMIVRGERWGHRVA